MQTQQTPSTSAPIPASIRRRSAAPPVDDRVAADLRGRAKSPTWHQDVDLCLDLRTWAQARDLSHGAAANALSVSHVTPEAFGRLREFKRPVGLAVMWTELIVAAADALTPRHVKTKPVQQMLPIEPTTTMQVDLAKLAQTIESETNDRGQRTPRRTDATARLIIAALKPYGAVASQRGRANPALGRGIKLLARDLAALPGTTVKMTGWKDRIQKYTAVAVRAMARDKKAEKARAKAETPAPATTAPNILDAPVVGPTMTMVSAVEPQIVGRPVLLASGAIKATVTTSSVLEIDPSSPLYAAAVAAVNVT